jgi:hypothetical protein
VPRVVRPIPDAGALSNARKAASSGSTLVCLKQLRKRDVAHSRVCRDDLRRPLRRRPRVGCRHLVEDLAHKSHPSFVLPVMSAERAVCRLVRLSRTAFDLLELDGEDLRRKPIEFRKGALNDLLRRQQSGIVFNQHYKARCETIFRLACELGCEGIVSKRLGSPYRSGRSKYWLKVKNPKAPAAKREAEEDWGNKVRRRGR